MPKKPKKKKPTRKSVPARAKSGPRKAALKSTAKKSQLKKSKKTAPKWKPKKSTAKQLAKLREQRSEDRVRHSRPGIREISGISVPEDRDFRSASGGQSGDLQGLSTIAEADSESVGELEEEGQALEAEVVSGVENAPDADTGPVRARARRSRPSDFDNEPDPESQT